MITHATMEPSRVGWLIRLHYDDTRFGNSIDPQSRTAHNMMSWYGKMRRSRARCPRRAYMADGYGELELYYRKRYRRQRWKKRQARRGWRHGR